MLQCLSPLLDDGGPLIVEDVGDVRSVDDGLGGVGQFDSRELVEEGLMQLAEVLVPPAHSPSFVQVLDLDHVLRVGLVVGSLPYHGLVYGDLQLADVNGELGVVSSGVDLGVRLGQMLEGLLVGTRILLQAGAQVLRKQTRRYAALAVGALQAGAILYHLLVTLQLLYLLLLNLASHLHLVHRSRQIPVRLHQLLCALGLTLVHVLYQNRQFGN